MSWRPINRYQHLDAVLDHFVKCCDDFYLQLNVEKTKDMMTDFCKKPSVRAQTFVKGTAVEIVSHYKYLGTILDDKLSFETNSDAICRKANQRLFYLRKPRCFNDDIKLLNKFIMVKLSQKIIGSSLNELDSV